MPHAPLHWATLALRMLDGCQLHCVTWIIKYDSIRCEAAPQLGEVVFAMPQCACVDSLQYHTSTTLVCRLACSCSRAKAFVSTDRRVLVYCEADVFQLLDAAIPVCCAPVTLAAVQAVVGNGLSKPADQVWRPASLDGPAQVGTMHPGCDCQSRVWRF